MDVLDSITHVVPLSWDGIRLNGLTETRDHVSAPGKGGNEVEILHTTNLRGMTRISGEGILEKLNTGSDAEMISDSGRTGHRSEL